MKEQKIMESTNNKIQVEIFDTPGKDRFLSREYYEKAKGILLVFSLEDRASFDGIQVWFEEELINLKNSIPIFLVGNKQDLKERLVTHKEIQKRVDQYKIKYYEVSAKDNTKVEEMFLELVNLIKPRIERLSSRTEFKSMGNFVIESN